MLKMQHSKPKSRRQSSMAMNSTSTSRRYESSSKICEPMCACTPTSSRWARVVEAAHRLCRAAVGEPEAELAVLLAGLHEVVRVGAHAGRDAHEHLLAHARAPRPRPRGARSPRTSRRRSGRCRTSRPNSISAHRLVVAVEVDALRREAGGAGGGQLAAGGHVERQVLLGHELAHRAAAERLAGVDDLVQVGERAEGRVIGAALVAQRLLVVDEQRRAELVRQVDDVAAADLEVAGGVVDGGVRIDERVRHGRRSYLSQNSMPGRACTPAS